MKPLVIASREEVAGFALAGVEGIVATKRDEVERAIAQTSPDETLLILGAAAAAAIDERIASWERSGKGPMYVVLPA